MVFNISSLITLMNTVDRLTFYVNTCRAGVVVFVVDTLWAGVVVMIVDISSAGDCKQTK